MPLQKHAREGCGIEAPFIESHITGGMDRLIPQEIPGMELTAKAIDRFRQKNEHMNRSEMPISTKKKRGGDCREGIENMQPKAVSLPPGVLSQANTSKCLWNNYDTDLSGEHDTYSAFKATSCTSDYSGDECDLQNIFDMYNTLSNKSCSELTHRQKDKQASNDLTIPESYVTCKNYLASSGESSYGWEDVVNDAAQPKDNTNSTATNLLSGTQWRAGYYSSDSEESAKNESQSNASDRKSWVNKRSSLSSSGSERKQRAKRKNPSNPTKPKAALSGDLRDSTSITETSDDTNRTQNNKSEESKKPPPSKSQRKKKEPESDSESTLTSTSSSTSSLSSSSTPPEELKKRPAIIGKGKGDATKKSPEKPPDKPAPVKKPPGAAGKEGEKPDADKGGGPKTLAERERLAHEELAKLNAAHDVVKKDISNFTKSLLKHTNPFSGNKHISGVDIPSHCKNAWQKISFIRNKLSYLESQKKLMENMKADCVKRLVLIEKAKAKAKAQGKDPEKAVENKSKLSRAASKAKTLLKKDKKDKEDYEEADKRLGELLQSIKEDSISHTQAIKRLKMGVPDDGLGVSIPPSLETTHEKQEFLEAKITELKKIEATAIKQRKAVQRKMKSTQQKEVSEKDKEKANAARQLIWGSEKKHEEVKSEKTEKDQHKTEEPKIKSIEKMKKPETKEVADKDKKLEEVGKVEKEPKKLGKLDKHNKNFISADKLDTDKVKNADEAPAHKQLKEREKGHAEKEAKLDTMQHETHKKPTAKPAEPVLDKHIKEHGTYEKAGFLKPEATKFDANQHSMKTLVSGHQALDSPDDSADSLLEKDRKHPTQESKLKKRTRQSKESSSYESTETSTSSKTDQTKNQKPKSKAELEKGAGRKPNAAKEAKPPKPVVGWNASESSTDYDSEESVSKPTKKTAHADGKHGSTKSLPPWPTSQKGQSNTSSVTETESSSKPSEKEAKKKQQPQAPSAQKSKEAGKPAQRHLEERNVKQVQQEPKHALQHKHSSSSDSDQIISGKGKKALKKEQEEEKSLAEARNITDQVAAKTGLLQQGLEFEYSPLKKQLKQPEAPTEKEASPKSESYAEKYKRQQQSEGSKQKQLLNPELSSTYQQGSEELTQQDHGRNKASEQQESKQGKKPMKIIVSPPDPEQSGYLLDPDVAEKQRHQSKDQGRSQNRPLESDFTQKERDHETKSGKDEQSKPQKPQDTGRKIIMVHGNAEDSQSDDIPEDIEGSFSNKEKTYTGDETEPSGQKEDMYGSDSFESEENSDTSKGKVQKENIPKPHHDITEQRNIIIVKSGKDPDEQNFERQFDAQARSSGTAARGGKSQVLSTTGQDMYGGELSMVPAEEPMPEIFQGQSSLQDDLSSYQTRQKQQKKQDMHRDVTHDSPKKKGMYAALSSDSDVPEQKGFSKQKQHTDDPIHKKPQPSDVPKQEKQSVPPTKQQDAYNSRQQEPKHSGKSQDQFSSPSPDEALQRQPKSKSAPKKEEPYISMKQLYLQQQQEQQEQERYGDNQSFLDRGLDVPPSENRKKSKERTMYDDDPDGYVHPSQKSLKGKDKGKFQANSEQHEAQNFDAEIAKMYPDEEKTNSELDLDAMLEAGSLSALKKPKKTKSKGKFFANVTEFYTDRQKFDADVADLYPDVEKSNSEPDLEAMLEAGSISGLKKPPQPKKQTQQQKRPQSAKQKPEPQPTATKQAMYEDLSSSSETGKSGYVSEQRQSDKPPAEEETRARLSYPSHSTSSAVTQKTPKMPVSDDILKMKQKYNAKYSTPTTSGVNQKKELSRNRQVVEKMPNRLKENGYMSYPSRSASSEYEANGAIKIRPKPKLPGKEIYQTDEVTIPRVHGKSSVLLSDTGHVEDIGSYPPDHVKPKRTKHEERHGIQHRTPAEDVEYVHRKGDRSGSRSPHQEYKDRRTYREDTDLSTSNEVVPAMNERGKQHVPRYQLEMDPEETYNRVKIDKTSRRTTQHKQATYQGDTDDGLQEVLAKLDHLEDMDALKQKELSKAKRQLHHIRHKAPVRHLVSPPVTTSDTTVKPFSAEARKQQELKAMMKLMNQAERKLKQAATHRTDTCISSQTEIHGYGPGTTITNTIRKQVHASKENRGEPYLSPGEIQGSASESTQLSNLAENRTLGYKAYQGYQEDIRKISTRHPFEKLQSKGALAEFRKKRTLLPELQAAINDPFDFRTRKLTLFEKMIYNDRFGRDVPKEHVPAPGESLEERITGLKEGNPRLAKMLKLDRAHQMCLLYKHLGDEIIRLLKLTHRELPGYERMFPGEDLTTPTRFSKGLWTKPRTIAALNEYVQWFYTEVDRLTLSILNICKDSSLTSPGLEHVSEEYGQQSQYMGYMGAGMDQATGQPTYSQATNRTQFQQGQAMATTTMAQTMPTYQYQPVSYMPQQQAPMTPMYQPMPTMNMPQPLPVTYIPQSISMGYMPQQPMYVPPNQSLYQPMPMFNQMGGMPGGVPGPVYDSRAMGAGPQTLHMSPILHSTPYPSQFQQVQAQPMGQNGPSHIQGVQQGQNLSDRSYAQGPNGQSQPPKMQDFSHGRNYSEPSQVQQGNGYNTFPSQVHQAYNPNVSSPNQVHQTDGYYTVPSQVHQAHNPNASYPNQVHQTDRYTTSVPNQIQQTNGPSSSFPSQVQQDSGYNQSISSHGEYSNGPGSPFPGQVQQTSGPSSSLPSQVHQVHSPISSSRGHVHHTTGNYTIPSQVQHNKPCNETCNRPSCNCGSPMPSQVQHVTRHNQSVSSHVQQDGYNPSVPSHAQQASCPSSPNGPNSSDPSQVLHIHSHNLLGSSQGQEIPSHQQHTSQMHSILGGRTQMKSGQLYGRGRNDQGVQVDAKNRPFTAGPRVIADIQVREDEEDYVNIVNTTALPVTVTDAW